MTVSVKVFGPYACFTRPELHTERVTYNVMTPTAARGVLESILWKPEFEYEITEIQVLKPIQHFSITRNEVKSVASHRVAESWAKNNGVGGYDAIADRTQRHSLILKDVAYNIKANIHLKAHAKGPPRKYIAMFERRVKNGQARNQPFLGNREFSAYFEAVDPNDKPISYTENVGRMLHTMKYNPDPNGPLTIYQHDENGRKPVKASVHRTFFNATLKQGVLIIPPETR